MADLIDSTPAQSAIGPQPTGSSATTTDRFECVRAGVASVVIEGGEVSPETQALLDQWARGDITDDGLMQAIIAPYASRR